MNKKETKKNIKHTDKFATMLGLIGVILMLISFWSNGWNIVRYCVTGLFLYIWAQVIFHSNEVRREKNEIV